MDKKKPIIALDVNSKEEALIFLDQFLDKNLNIKVGMELFYSAGPTFVQEIVQRGHSVFLDLKLYDIPNTVERSMVQLAKLGVSMVNVHASGGVEMMEAALSGLKKGSINQENKPLLIGVTQLTSRDPLENETELQLSVTQEENIIHLAKLTQQSGLDGVVCSPLEAKVIHENTQPSFLTITPGIRLANHKEGSDDQVRVTTPFRAAELGSDYIVVGRPITQASDPVKQYEMILKEWQKALEEVR